MSKVKVAAAQYDIGFFKDWSQFTDKLTQWVAEAVEEKAKLLVFPEYGSMELASLFGEAIYTDLGKQLHSMQDVYADWQDLHHQLSKQYDVMMLASTFPVLQEDGTFRNRANLYAPDGLIGFQDKLIMTRFENEQWLIHPGQQIKVLDTDVGRIGISICYDIEFPMIAYQQVNAGADLILAPSCTDTQAGFHRVRIGCQARALENQCYVVQSPTFGEARWSEAVDVNTGRASIYTPVDYGFTDNGILIEGVADKPGWVCADLDLTEIARVREEGQVFNYRDWPLQHTLSGPD
ncbi:MULTISPECIES: carbon-nitrogen hydrolase family protein [unclassified Methylophaga]|jgi:predicted amidohydrolase|uniref:carbon-nitrogen hydrolase family protein n=1 Tax=unclassified Methylophaga TaxID=2629249 RepID=UPI000C992687|nr:MULTISPECIES: carbon-nitrogen hydrolase family protein [unclassified Methylophaga]MAK67614.1 amidohydrolase [Methylophaga sp.]MAY18848.1 amidohydrolase [Methylophaga sp.]|tara:strand:+ start:1128 stop:2003 length:876 start_codon:yes stop_codon:yes gene_type:complete